VTVKSRALQQLLRYGIIGVATNASMYGAYLLLTTMGVESKTTMTLLYLVGASIGFVGNRQWAFEHNGPLLGTGRRYLLAHFSGYLLNLILLITFVDVLGFQHQLVQAIAIGIVAGFLYLLFKYYVFPKTERAVGASNETVC